MERSRSGRLRMRWRQPHPLLLRALLPAGLVPSPGEAPSKAEGHRPDTTQMPGEETTLAPLFLAGR